MNNRQRTIARIKKNKVFVRKNIFREAKKIIYAPSYMPSGTFTLFCTTLKEYQLAYLNYLYNCTKREIEKYRDRVKELA